MKNLVFVTLLLFFTPYSANASRCDFSSYTTSNEEAYLASDVVFKASEIVRKEDKTQALVEKIFKNKEGVLKQNEYVILNSLSYLDKIYTGTYIYGFIRENRPNQISFSSCWKVQYAPSFYQQRMYEDEQYENRYVIAATLEKAEHSYEVRNKTKSLSRLYPLSKLTFKKVAELHSGDKAIDDMFTIETKGGCGPTYKLGEEYIVEFSETMSRHRDVETKRIIKTPYFEMQCLASGPVLYAPDEFFEGLNKKYRLNGE